MSGSLVFYSAGVFDGFASAALFIALKDTPIVNKIFQRGPHATEIFTFDGYILVGNPDTDIVHYEIRNGPYFHLKFIIFVITSDPHCGPSSSIDLIEFIWHNSERFNAFKYAIVLGPKSVTCPPKLLCMRYYRAISDGWSDDSVCVKDYQLTMGDLTGCHSPGVCHCHFCVMQPPSLRDLASHTLFKLKFDIPKFELTVHKNFKECAYAVRLGMVDIDRLLPPELPVVCLR